MKKLRLIIFALVVLIILLGVTGAMADSDHPEYRWLAGAGVVDFPNPGDTACDLGVPCPDVATASNGDTIEIAGEGTLSVHPKSVTGSGTFTHNFAGGGSVSGTWEAIQLLSFKSYGSSPVLPSTWEAGKAIIRVQLTANGLEFDGILTVGCILPEVKVPGGTFEGSTLNVQDVLNFNKADLGATLFIRQ